ncbi:MAG: endonuclease domain-containing protein [Actinomycetota bacterium]|nr:endonuclease domain-containing protein [Actinomycetota bacterium]
MPVDPWSGGIDRAAARLWGLDRVEADVVELSVPRQTRLSTAVVHRSNDLADVGVTEVDAIPCTDLTRTLVDLGAVVDLDVVERAVESALRQRLTTVSRLQWRLSGLARRGRRGPAALRAVLECRPLRAPPTESQLETMFLQCLQAAGVEEPVRQHPVRLPDGRVVRLDDAYPEAMVFIELDGWTAHRSQQAFHYDRRRQNQVVLLGWQPLRFTWADVVGQPGRVAGEVAAMLRRRAVVVPRAASP